MSLALRHDPSVGKAALSPVATFWFGMPGAQEAPFWALLPQGPVFLEGSRLQVPVLERWDAEGKGWKGEVG